MAINKAKVATAGLAAGLVMGIIDVLMMKFVTGSQMTTDMNAFKAGLGDEMNVPYAWVSTIVMDLIMGVLLVWLYAAIRPRFGAGPRTAVYAGLFMWIVGTFFTVGFAMMGMMSWGLWCTYSLIWLVTLQIVTHIGGRLYTEDGTA